MSKKSMTEIVQQAVSEYYDTLEEDARSKTEEFLEKNINDLILNACGVEMGTIRWQVREDSPLGKKIAGVVDEVLRSLELPKVDDLLTDKAKRMLKREVSAMMDTALTDRVYSDAEELVDKLVMSEIKKRWEHNGNQDSL